jgi:hypothetical protein
MKFFMPRIYRKLTTVMMCAGFLFSPVASHATELKQETVRTWDVYVETSDLQMRERMHRNFLWVDESQDRIQRVRNGEILVSSVGPRSPKPVPSGLIHDWIGAAFIANARLEDVLFAARSYDQYKNFYQPAVVDSKSLGSAGDCDKYSMRVVNNEVITETALDGEFEACYVRVDAKRWYSIGHSTRVQEVRGYGRPDERDLPPGEGSGYIWRLYSIARFEQADDGVYVELEAIALSRDIPLAVRWLVAPVVRNISKNSLLTSLRQMQAAVRSTAVASKAKQSTTARKSNDAMIASGTK